MGRREADGLLPSSLFYGKITWISYISKMDEVCVNHLPAAPQILSTTVEFKSWWLKGQGKRWSFTKLFRAAVGEGKENFVCNRRIFSDRERETPKTPQFVLIGEWLSATSIYVTCWLVAKTCHLCTVLVLLVTWDFPPFRENESIKVRVPKVSVYQVSLAVPVAVNK